MHNPNKPQPKPISQIVHELMFEEILSKEQTYIPKNPIYSQPFKKPLKITISKNNYLNYVQQNRNINTSKPIKIDGQAFQSSQKKSIQIASFKKFINIVTATNTPQASLKVPPKKKMPRGMSVSDHFVPQNQLNQQLRLPIICKKKTQQELEVSESKFEGYRQYSEEMSLEIDEYMKMQNNQKLLPPINQL